MFVLPTEPRPRAVGSFAQWQPEYAEHGIATFPVKADKTPAVSNYLRMGQRASASLAQKFADADAFGFACRRSKLTILDIDSPSERLLADALADFGPTPLIIRSGSGHHQCWYANAGEPRRVRADPSRPIDILGDGFCVAPPSKVAKGSYSIIEGTLDDLASLPTMRQLADAVAPTETDVAPSVKAGSGGVPVGQRNSWLWRELMRAARDCPDQAALVEVAGQLNKRCAETLPDDEVLRTVGSAWDKTANGENWCGEGRVAFSPSLIDNLLDQDPDAFVLLAILKRHHWGRQFVVANAMAEHMPKGGWTRQRLAAARRCLISIGHIIEVRPSSSFHGPAIYEFGHVMN